MRACCVSGEADDCLTAGWKKFGPQVVGTRAVDLPWTKIKDMVGWSRLLGKSSDNAARQGVCFALRRMTVLLIGLVTTPLAASEFAPQISALVKENCRACHDGKSGQGGFDLSGLAWDLDQTANRARWIHIHERVEKREMPPAGNELTDGVRESLLELLGEAISTAERAEVRAQGRGPLRRLTREEYEQNLRDLLQLPQLDIRDMLPADREAHGFNKTAAVLDMSHVQMVAYLEAAEVALRQAVASGLVPPEVTKYRALGRDLFTETATFGEREAMFFAKNGKAVDNEELAELEHDPALEVAIFRSAHWPYYGYPRGFVAKLAGEYRVRFSARAVLQTKGFLLKPASESIPMTFRTRKPSGPDVSGDVQAAGGLMDVPPVAQVFETTIRLLPTETFEYSLLGLPVPLARNVDGGPPTYRYPPFPAGGQPGVAFQWLEVEGPIPPETWPPPSHRVLFDELGPELVAPHPEKEAARLLRRFVKRAAREPLPEPAVARYEKLVLDRLKEGVPFGDALLAGYKAFLCSSYFLYLREPSDPTRGDLDHFAIASRLSHFLTNTRPDATLQECARRGQLRQASILQRQTDRLIESPAFGRCVKNFTAYWLNLRHMTRDEPDVRLFPEYRFDNYLIESMQRETEMFFTAMLRENLPAKVLIDTDFVYANDRLAQHYKLEPLTGSQLRKVSLPQESPYGGLLTQAAILKVTANGTSTSPVVRGAWIMERLLGLPPPPPPPSVPGVEPDIRGAKTIRELLRLHAQEETCAACHARFDPVGVALENFDILGGWRTQYRGMRAGAESLSSAEASGEKQTEKTSYQHVAGIDRAGHDFIYTLTEAVDASGRLRDGRSFADIYELKELLAADSRQLARNLLHQFTVYATGTPVRFSERGEIERILDVCAKNDYGVRDLVRRLVQSKLFLGKEGCQ